MRQSVEGALCREWQASRRSQAVRGMRDYRAGWLVSSPTFPFCISSKRATEVGSNVRQSKPARKSEVQGARETNRREVLDGLARRFTQQDVEGKVAAETQQQTCQLARRYLSASLSPVGGMAGAGGVDLGRDVKLNAMLTKPKGARCRASAQGWLAGAEP